MLGGRRKRKSVELDHDTDAAIKRLRAPRALEACFDPMELMTLKKAFHRVDIDGSGSVSVSELSHVLVKRFDEAQRLLSHHREHVVDLPLDAVDE